jgi:multicomponent Na+:H+ antiporter subunit C
MSVAMIFAVGGLVAAGTFLVTSRSLSRIVLGFALLGHAAVLALLAAGGPAGSPPIVDGEPAADTSNPLPQALSLTAIVISFGLTLFVLALARRQQFLTGDDLVEDDVEDRRIATTHEEPIEPTDETRELEALHENSEPTS